MEDPYHKFGWENSLSKTSSPAVVRVFDVVQLLVPGAELDDQLLLLHHLPLLHQRLQDQARL